MHNIHITLTCSDSPLENKLFEGEKTINIGVADPTDPEEILNKLEPKVMELRGDNDVTLRIRAVNESGNTVLDGTIKNSFNGIVFS